MNSTSNVLEKYLISNSIHIDEKELSFQLESHPSYPSLHSLTGVLNHFNIENTALEVPCDHETLLNLPLSFIAHIINHNGEHFVLVIRNQKDIELVYNNNTKQALSFEKFLEQWTGIILAVEKPRETVQKKTDSNFLSKLLYFACLLALILLFGWNSPGLFQIAHFSLSLAGIFICILIVQQELGISSKPLAVFCRENDKNRNCSDVLNSKAAYVYKNIKLSDTGLVYFGGMILSWLFLSVSNTKDFSLLKLASIGAVPFTFYSFYYQSVVVKKWCPLCLSVLTILWLQALCLVIPGNGFDSTQINFQSSFIACSGFVLTAAFWLFMIPKLKKEQELRSLKVVHNRFKNNFEIFNALLDRNPAIDTTIVGTSGIILGNKNPDALLKLTLITNPLCSHCKKAHLAVESVLKSGNQQVQVTIRFNVNIKEPGSLDTKIALCLMNIDHLQDDDLTMQALNSAYSGIGPDEWLKIWKPYENDACHHELIKQREWCLKNNILFTPEILINGQSFPIEYEREDLVLFIDEIIERELQKRKNLNPEPQYINMNEYQ